MNLLRSRNWSRKVGFSYPSSFRSDDVASRDREAEQMSCSQPQVPLVWQPVLAYLRISIITDDNKDLGVREGLLSTAKPLPFPVQCVPCLPLLWIWLEMQM